MAIPTDTVTPGAPSAILTADEARWLHDKFERLAAEEVQLSGARTSYFAAIGTILITGAVVATSDFLNESLLLTLILTGLALLGVLISFVWVVVLHRTNDALAMWREAALHLEMVRAPIAGELRAPTTLRSGMTLDLNLLRPFAMHAERFSSKNPISWLDRVSPEWLTETLPLTFLSMWSGVLVVVWVWYLLGR